MRTFPAALLRLITGCVIGGSAAATTSGPEPPESRLPQVVHDAGLNRDHHPCRRIRLADSRLRRTTLSPTLAAVVQLAEQLERLDNSIEHGAILYRRADGTVRTGPIIAGDGNGILLTISPLPAESIVAVVHTHARYPYYTVDQSRLSEEDILLGRQLLALPRTDRSLRLYVIDNATRILAEYAANGRCIA